MKTAILLQIKQRMICKFSRVMDLSQQVESAATAKSPNVSSSTVTVSPPASPATSSVTAAAATTAVNLEPDEKP